MARFSFSECLRSDAASWVRAWCCTWKERARPPALVTWWSVFLPLEIRCRMKNRFLYFKSKLTLLILIGILNKILSLQHEREQGLSSVLC